MDTKNFLASKTIWGVVVTLAGVFGVADLLPENFADRMTDAINLGISLVGAVVAIYGRFKADKPVTVLPKGE